MTIIHLGYRPRGLLLLLNTDTAGEQGRGPFKLYYTPFHVLYIMDSNLPSVCLEYPYFSNYGFEATYPVLSYTALCLSSVRLLY